MKLCIWITLLFCAQIGFAAEFFLFLPGEKHTESLEREFQKEIPNIKVFSKANLLLRNVRESADNVVIAPEHFFLFNKGWQVAQKAKVNGFSNEYYFLITLNEEVKLENISQKKVGIWNQVGRQNSEKLMESLFGVTPKKVKNVNRKEDLYTLLGIDMVDAIIVPESLFEKLQQSSKAKFFVLGKSQNGYAPLSFGMKGKVGALEKKFQNIREDSWNKMNIEAWKGVRQ